MLLVGFAHLTRASIAENVYYFRSTSLDTPSFLRRRASFQRTLGMSMTLLE